MGDFNIIGKGIIYKIATNLWDKGLLNRIKYFPKIKMVFTYI